MDHPKEWHWQCNQYSISMHLVVMSRYVQSHFYYMVVPFFLRCCSVALLFDSRHCGFFILHTLWSRAGG